MGGFYTSKGVEGRGKRNTNVIHSKTSQELSRACISHNNWHRIALTPVMFNGGRPAQPIWKYFLRAMVDAKTHVICNISGHYQTPRREGMTIDQSLCGKLHNKAADSNIIVFTSVTKK